ncbi:MAG: phosphate acyltransferase PlsX [Armatimonadota bacterium]|nr:phosphate acyltransferase PlsX [Armatimonadota bacterium]
MKIAVDAMGGDYAPSQIVEGAVEAATKDRIPVILVGDEKAIEQELAKYPASSMVEVRHASETVGMDEHPANAIRRKTDSSIVVAANLVLAGEAQAMVSAGNTGAAMAVAIFKFGRIRGIDRPAICALLPTMNGKVVLLDAGANVDCTVENLLQFAVMGKEYAEQVLKLPNPRIGLLSIGEEPTKGNELTKATNARLRATPGLNFIGNVEGKDIFRGAADVVVCDGFDGNMVLKVSEGMAEFVLASLKKEIENSFISRLGALLAWQALKRARSRLDYAEYGGAPLLGVNGICVISHGRSNGRAIQNAIRAAAKAVENDVVGCISTSLQEKDLAWSDNASSKATSLNRQDTFETQGKGSSTPVS